MLIEYTCQRTQGTIVSVEQYLRYHTLYIAMWEQSNSRRVMIRNALMTELKKPSALRRPQVSSKTTVSDRVVRWYKSMFASSTHVSHSDRRAVEISTLVHWAAQSVPVECADRVVQQRQAFLWLCTITKQHRPKLLSKMAGCSFKTVHSNDLCSSCAGSGSGHLPGGCPAADEWRVAASSPYGAPRDAS